MGVDEKILQALTEQGKLLTELRVDMAGVKTDIAGVKTDIAGLQAVQQEQGKDLKEINSRLTRVGKDIQLVLKYHDENVLNLRSRIERLEEHAGLDNS
jgi:chromosome segregation ATPase